MRRRMWMPVMAMYAMLLPPPVAAQTADAVGIVTTLDGRATVARSALSAPLALKFKDDVFGRDRISTQENSLVRVLLEGKAILTVRELSQVTISEEPGRAVVTLPSGKVVLAVQKQRMRPGESIEIRTPNAVAAVRGSILAVAYDVTQNQTTAICHSGDCTYQFAGGTTNPLPPGQGARNALIAPVSAAERNTAVTVQTSGPQFKSLDAASENTLLLSQANQAVQLAQFVNTGVLPTIPPGPATNPSTAAPVNAITNTPIEAGQVPGAPTGTPSPPPPGSGPGGNPSPPPPSKQIVNGGFEGGTLSPWTLTGTGEGGAGVVATPGSGGVIPALGPIVPPAGSSMGIIHTGGTFQLNGISVPNVSSTLTQSFNVTGGKLYTVLASVNFLSNEHPFQGPGFDDTWQISARSPGETSFTLLKQETRNSVFIQGNTSVNTSTAPASGAGFATTGPAAYGVTGFRDFSLPWTPTGSGTADLAFNIFDVGDASVDSAILIDQVAILEDPPLYLVRSGETLTRTTSEPLLHLINTPATFDTLLAVGAGGRAMLAGPLLQAVDSNLTVPFSLLTVFQGGRVVSSSTDALTFLSGGTHSFGRVGVPMFDLSGTSIATDHETGLTLGTDRPLQHGGSLLEAINATVSAHQAVRVDTALLEATAPLLALRNGSTLTTATSGVQLSYQAKVTSLGSLVKLDRSAMTVASGAALSVGGGSLLRVTGDLFSLSNGSILSVLSGPLVSLNGGSILNVNGALIGFGGTGGNVVKVANGLCPCTTIGGIPVSLTGGALASNVTINGAIKNSSLGSLNVTPNAAVIRVDGAATKVTINGM